MIQNLVWTRRVGLAALLVASGVACTVENGGALSDESVGATAQAVVNPDHLPPYLSAVTVNRGGAHQTWLFRKSTTGALIGSRYSHTSEAWDATVQFYHETLTVRTPIATVWKKSFDSTATDTIVLYMLWNDGQIWAAYIDIVSQTLSWGNVSASAGLAPFQFAKLDSAVITGIGNAAQTYLAMRDSSGQLFALRSDRGVWKLTAVLGRSGAQVLAPSPVTFAQDGSQLVGRQWLGTSNAAWRALQTPDRDFRVIWTSRDPATPLPASGIPFPGKFTSAATLTDGTYYRMSTDSRMYRDGTRLCSVQLSSNPVGSSRVLFAPTSTGDLLIHGWTQSCATVANAGVNSALVAANDSTIPKLTAADGANVFYVGTDGWVRHCRLRAGSSSCTPTALVPYEP